MKTLLLSVGAGAILAGMALGVDAPTKDGLWSFHMLQTTTPAGNAAPKTTDITLSRCQGKDTPLPIPGNSATVPECKLISRNSEGSTTVIEMRCTQNGRKTRMKQMFTMNGENEGHTIVDSTFDPPMNGMTGMKMVADWKYIGACPAGVKPNDVVGPDGKVITPPKP